MVQVFRKFRCSGGSGVQMVQVFRRFRCLGGSSSRVEVEKQGTRDRKEVLGYELELENGADAFGQRRGGEQGGELLCLKQAISLGR